MAKKPYHERYDDVRAADEAHDDHISPNSYEGQKLSRFSTNFKHDMETRTEYKDRRKAEAVAEALSIAQQVDERDGNICRVTGVFLTAGHPDPHKRKEQHHMKPRSTWDRDEAETTANRITISAFVHQLIHAGKIYLSGDANLRDADGNLCGVLQEVMTEGGWKAERML